MGNYTLIVLIKIFSYFDKIDDFRQLNLSGHLDNIKIR